MHSGETQKKHIKNTYKTNINYNRRQTMKITKENKIRIALIGALYLICWINIYAAKFNFINMKGGIENYLYSFHIGALLIGIIIYLIPYEKIIKAIDRRITDIAKSHKAVEPQITVQREKIIFLFLTNVIGSIFLYLYICNNNMAWGQSDHLILILNFMFPFLIIKLLLERCKKVTGIILCSIIVYFNVGMFIVLSGKFCLSCIVFLIFYVSIYLIMKGGKNERGVYISFAVGLVLLTITAYFTGHVNKYIHWIQTYRLGLVQPKNKAFEMIWRLESEVGLIAFFIEMVVIVLLGYKLSRNVYKISKWRGTIIFGVTLLFALTNGYRLLAEMEYVPYCVLNTFRNEINLPLMAIAFRLAKVNKENEVKHG